MNKLRLMLVCSALAGTMTFATADLALAQDAPEDEAVHCLSLNRIRSSDVISDRYILFRMRDNTAYVNVLRHACPGLRRNKAIMYRTSVGQLCDLDIITVLEDIGFGLMPGASCGLGTFQPIDEEGIADLKEAAKEGRL